MSKDKRNANQNLPNRWKIPIKYLIVVGVIFVPVILTMLIFAPFIAQKANRDYTQRYQLKEDFTLEDIDVIVEKMKGDSEFHFYFAVLTQNNVNLASKEVYGILDQNRSKDEMFTLAANYQNQIDGLSLFFNSLNFPAEFYTAPLKHPDLSHSLWDFIFEEFKLSIIGICYKSTYDLTFSFQWRDEAKQAALKVQSILLDLTKEQRQAIGNAFKS